MLNNYEQFDVSVFICSCNRYVVNTDDMCVMHDCIDYGRVWDRSEGNSIILTDVTLSHEIFYYSNGNSITRVALTRSQVGALGAMMEGAVTMESMKHIMERRKGWTNNLLAVILLVTSEG